jgi:hypothetical protein
MRERGESDLQWSVSSASVAPEGLDRKEPFKAPAVGTRAMVRRMVELNREVLLPAGIEDASVSLLPSIDIAPELADRLLTDRGMSISSGFLLGIPGKNSPPLYLRGLVRAIGEVFRNTLGTPY